ncbi:MAG TPA: DVUA0089 family protein [Tepidisphaeraceae bacterium]|jgi:hypothetical protein|nr:DVUA0089 family protein [Tepidisphaeraceae bacterium]
MNNCKNAFRPALTPPRSRISLHLHPLEPRLLLSTINPTDLDPDDQISEAANLGALTQSRSAQNQIDSSTDVDLFSFTVSANQKISFDIDPTPAAQPVDSLLRLFDQNGNQLAANDNSPAPGESASLESFLSYTFPTAGTYYIAVSSSANNTYDPLTGGFDTPGPTGPYTLILSPGLTGTISGNVGNGNETYLVDLLHLGSNPPPITTNPSQQTWIIIHGRSSSRYSSPTPNIPRLAAAILVQRPNDQVLTLDWSGPATAQSGLFFREEDWIQPVAAWAASALLAYGFNAQNINLIGHSWGGNMTDELAERLGSVNTIVAIDPAKDGGGNYNPNANFGTPAAQINFAAHSGFSWAFYSRDGGVLGITAGNEQTPTSADEAIVVTNSEHSKLVNLISFMLENPTVGVARFFKLARLLNHQTGPWVPDRYDYHAAAAAGGYEAVISAAAGGESPSSLAYIRADFTPPAVIDASFEYQTAPRQLRYQFSEDVFDTLGRDDVLIKNLATSALFNPTALHYDPATNTALFDLPAQLADANYTATLKHDEVKDLATNTIAADHTLTFFILTGDLNGDRQVTISDFIDLASNFNKSPATWADGDLNYDSVVTISDFIDLAANFGQSLPVPAMPALSTSAAFTLSRNPHARKHHRRHLFLPWGRLHPPFFARSPLISSPLVHPRPI